MKKTLFLLATVLLIYSCKNKEEDPQPAQPKPVQWFDTMEFCKVTPPDGYEVVYQQDSSILPIYEYNYNDQGSDVPHGKRIYYQKACDFYYFFTPTTIQEGKYYGSIWRGSGAQFWGGGTEPQTVIRTFN